jgi:hypothetical protein
MLENRRFLLLTTPVLALVAARGKDNPNWQNLEFAMQVAAKEIKRNPNCLWWQTGFHDTPKIGGSLDPVLARDDYLTMGGKSVTIIQPTAEGIQPYHEVGMGVTLRVMLRANEYDPEGAARGILAEQLAISQPGDKIKAWNEVNSKSETGEVQVGPEVHAKNHGIPIMEQILEANRQPVISDVSQRHLSFLNDGRVLDDNQFKFLYVKTLKDLKGGEWLKQAVHAVHAYTFSLWENPLNYIRQTHQIVSEAAGFNMPLVGVERGFYESCQADLRRTVGSDYANYLIALDLISQSARTIPSNIKFTDGNLWVGANFAQRPPGDQEEGVAKTFEDAAFRTLEGVTLSYLVMERLKQLVLGV